MNIDSYLKGKEISKISVGQSGADVYIIDGDYILKHVKRENLEGDLFDTYSREARFYKERSSCCDYIPEIIDLKLTENEIILLMRRYDTPNRTSVDDILIQKIAGLLAKIHTDRLPSFIDPAKDKAVPLTKKEINDCIDGWKSVLDEHPSEFELTPLTEIADHLNDLIMWHDTEERVMVHGDFHFDNLLTDKNGNILICDWQGLRSGQASDDLSFFMSRLEADGIIIDPLKFISLYVSEIKRIKGSSPDPSDILRHLKAANVITTFLYWHFFLHGNPSERVRQVYEKMIADMSESLTPQEQS